MITSDAEFLEDHKNADEIEVDESGRPIVAHYYPETEAKKERQRIIRRANGSV